VRLALAPWGETMAELVAAARAAEAAGFDSVWTTELHRTAFVTAAAIAGATSRVKVGSGIALAFVRSPMITALTALDLDDLAGGRFLLGLGPGVRRLTEDWHHATYGSPGRHLAETVEVIRRVVAGAHTGEPLDFEGEYEPIHMRGYERPWAPVRTSIPIYLAAVGPVMLRTTGRVADGWISHELNSPRYLRERALPLLEAGRAAAGPERGKLEIVASAVCHVDRDGRAAKRWAARLVAFYATVRSYQDFFEFHGFGAEARAVQERFRAGDEPGMAAAVPDAMVDALTLAGEPDEVRERLGAYEGLADVVKLSPLTHLVPAQVSRKGQHALLELFAGAA
jgi:probable F420-dependent oxidoreductase